jgi:prepilin-type N-terminal cleavage/methylation domain-containing protein
MDNCREKMEQGFTLVELLIAMALGLVILGALSNTFIMQQKTYAVQEQVAEMTENIRGAMDIMTSEIMMTGYGAPTSNMSTWIDWVTGVTMDANPKIEDGASGGSDTFHIAACFDESMVPVTLTANASEMDTTITVSDGSEFNTTTKKLIRIGNFENAVVTAVGVNTLTIDTDPALTGKGLTRVDDLTTSNAYQVGDPVCIVKVISYHVASNTLERNENDGDGFIPLAENIVDLQIAQTDETITIDPLTIQADKPDPNYSENNGYRKLEQRTEITPPNLIVN